MKAMLLRAGLVTMALAGTAALSACGGTTSTGAAPASSSAAPSSASSSAAASSTAKQTASASASKTANNAGGGKDVDCGPVKGPSDIEWHAVAESTSAGTPGCTEVLDVLSEYLMRAATESEGTAHALTVDGWDCLADTGASGSGAIGCDKDGFSFHGTR